MMRKVVFLCVGVILSAGTMAFAFAPEGQTSQAWYFSTPDPGPMLPDYFVNPYGTPLLTVGNYWFDVIDGHQGVWGLSGRIDVYIPNRPEALPVKWIWLDLIWKPAELCDGLLQYDLVGVVSFDLPAEPMVSVVPSEFMSMSHTDEELGDGWVQTLFEIYIYPNPPEEWITITGDILVDSLVIDTICIPEPPMILLLGLGGLALLRKH